eukprot:m.892545 g.892545  ORF g.892545 m.892545 type:complete len:407 (+) comp23656_c1_seq14:41-1261(+)
MDYSRSIRGLWLVSVLVLMCLVQGCSGATADVQLDNFRSILQRIVNDLQGQYNMSVAAALYRGDTRRSGHESSIYKNKAMPPNTSIAVAAGYTDAGLDMGHASREALPDDVYVWGSITKMYTGPAVLQLVEKGLVDLNDPISMHIDPLLEHINGSRLIDHFGTNISRVQIHHLLHMTSGLEDFDGEDYAQYQFSHRHYDFSPIEIIGKYVPGRLRYSPGSRQSYCSTNYVLLGLVLANHIHGTSGSNYSWSTYHQKDVIPAALREAFKTTDFVNHGPCEEHTPVHGFTAGYTTAVIPPQDVWNVSCAGGWTAGNFLGSVGDVAQYTYDLYNVDNPMVRDCTCIFDRVFLTSHEHPHILKGMPLIICKGLCMNRHVLQMYKMVLFQWQTGETVWCINVGACLGEKCP